MQQKSVGQYLIKIPQSATIDVEALYQRLLQYIQDQNVDQLLSARVDTLEGNFNTVEGGLNTFKLTQNQKNNNLDAKDLIFEHDINIINTKTDALASKDSDLQKQITDNYNGQSTINFNTSQAITNLVTTINSNKTQSDTDITKLRTDFNTETNRLSQEDQSIKTNIINLQTSIDSQFADLILKDSTLKASIDLLVTEVDKNILSINDIKAINANQSDQIAILQNRDVVLDNKFNSYYNKIEIDNKIVSAGSVDLTKYYTKPEVDSKISSIQLLKGDKGEQGPKGEKGEQGEQGIQGIPGKDGTSLDITNYYTKSEVDSLNATQDVKYGTIQSFMDMLQNDVIKKLEDRIKDTEDVNNEQNDKIDDVNDKADDLDSKIDSEITKIDDKYDAKITEQNNKFVQKDLYALDQVTQNNTNTILYANINLKQDKIDLTLYVLKTELAKYYLKTDIDLTKYLLKTDIDLTKYYLKTETDTKLSLYYLKTDIDLTRYYSKQDIDNKLLLYYLKTDIDLTKYYLKTDIDLTKYYLKTEIDSKFTLLDLTQYLKANITVVTSLNTNYRINYNQILNVPSTDLTNYLQKNPTDVITFNQAYYINYSNINNWPNNTSSYPKLMKFEGGLRSLVTLNELLDKAQQGPSQQNAQRPYGEFFRMVQHSAMKSSWQDGVYYSASTVEDNALSNNATYSTYIRSKPIVPGLAGNPGEKLKPYHFLQGTSLSDANLINNDGASTFTYPAIDNNGQQWWYHRTGIFIREQVESITPTNTQYPLPVRTKQESLIYIGSSHNTALTLTQNRTQYPNCQLNDQAYESQSWMNYSATYAPYGDYKLSGGRYPKNTTSSNKSWQGMHIKNGDGETSGFISDGNQIVLYCPADDSVFLQGYDEDNDMNTSQPIFYISSTGQFVTLSTLKVKQSIRPKTNNQKVLNKLINLDIITSSYTKNLSESKKDNEQSIKRKIQKERALEISISRESLSRERLHYTLDRTKQNQGNMINGSEKETSQIEEGYGVKNMSMIPYIIMGMKALNENIIKLEQRVENQNNAMLLTLDKIDQISSQTNSKIEEVQQNSVMSDINNDTIDELKEKVYKLIENNTIAVQKNKEQDQQIKTLNAIINSQGETIKQMQETIQKLVIKCKIIL